MDSLRLAIAASFTADPIDDVLSHWWDEWGVPARTEFAPYNQVFQALLDGDGPLARNRRGANVVLVRVDQWRDGLAGADELAEAVRQSAGTAAVPHLVVCCPPAPGADGAAAEAHLAAALAGDARVRVITSADITDQYPVADYFDAYGERSADVPYTRAMFAALGTVVARAVHAWLTPRPKVIAVDADNTLWDGVVGEDGVLGVRVPAGRRALQEFLLAQRAAGRLIALCSKNTEADVLAVLADHPDMVLRPEHVTAHRIDWRPKSANLAALAAELDLGLDSFVFLDDNPVEVAEVRAAHPEVLALALPAAADAVVPYLRHCWPLDHVRVTADDERRADRYRVEAQRRAARTEAPSLASFLDGLGLVVDVRPMAPADAGRTAQLTQRTNQFNLTTVRRTAAELTTVDVLVVEVADRFGSYGQVGVVVHGARGDRLAVETFLLSCRVLGRGVEHRVLAVLGALARERGLADVALAYAPTDRNRPAYDFLTGLPGVRRDGDAFLVSTSDALAARYEPPVVAPTAELSTAAAPLAERAPADTTHRIASGRTTAAQVLAAVDARRAAAPAAAIQTDDPTEAHVARIWAELLDFAPSSVHDNFHELGGHSLALVRFAVRVRDDFGVELPVDALFTDAFTVADIARTIREHQSADLDDLLAELEQLTDDEVRALLDADR
ncbi:HAD-IIIC family phosphatase [Phytohabitans rumicis]|uniref:Methoxymalonyl-ACP biosynthesis protein FkbH n=1 Tax=Phytohabitans rumicis TaxID=1076125 RepID=A0A6V8LNX7_9ACTN|nr:HAD-IIIC family phosphatase [Phytohabitans rumicis]GFJ94415.1 methoxymalonyl-ACP biosynthesis protein FkbH [Phytohabitans rumicis]